MYKITKVIKETIPSFRIGETLRESRILKSEKPPDRYNEALSKEANLTMKKKMMW